MKIFRATFHLAAWLLCTACLSFAQTATGEVSGTINDNSGGSVAGASVKLTNQDTQIVDRVKTNQVGYFLFINVRPGSYTLTVEMAGFKTARVNAFELSVNQHLTQNLTLDVGALAESVVVTAEAPLLQQSTSKSFYKQLIYDPSSTVCSGATCTRLPFPNQVIPQGQIVPAVTILFEGLSAAAEPWNFRTRSSVRGFRC
jgi:Carboxypeptidase regulatory-like domain